jgi:hypothetical protein
MNGTYRGIALMVAAALTYDTMSAVTSSPQTTEINASLRAESLMKWVNLGLGQAAIFVTIAAVVSKREGEPAWPILLGGGLAGGMLYAQYVHAKQVGLSDGKPPTEVPGGFG